MELKAGRRGREGVVFGGFAAGDGRGGARAAGAEIGDALGADVVSSWPARARKSASATSPNKSSDDMAPASAHLVHTRLVHKHNFPQLTYSPTLRQLADHSAVTDIDLSWRSPTPVAANSPGNWPW